MSFTTPLEEFVAHSNRIEREPDRPGHPLFDDHLAVARRVQAWALSATRPVAMSPLAIHRALLKSQPAKFPGELRQCRVEVNGLEKMPPAEVRPRFARLIGDAQFYVFIHRTKNKRLTEERIWAFHHELEWIHPFVDGNGRTGRLWMNAIRLSVGFPWLTVEYGDRFAYYRAIQDWEHEKRV